MFLSCINFSCNPQRYMQVMDDLNNRPVGDRFYSKKVATIATSVDKFQDRNYNSPPKSPRVEIMEVAKANKVWKKNQVVLLLALCAWLSIYAHWSPKIQYVPVIVKIYMILLWCDEFELYFQKKKKVSFSYTCSMA